jgi:hypothetical protein
VRGRKEGPPKEESGDCMGDGFLEPVWGDSKNKVDEAKPVALRDYIHYLQSNQVQE